MGKRERTPKEVSWESEKAMMKSATFSSSVHALPGLLEEGTCLGPNVDAARALLESVEGDTVEERCAYMRRCSTCAANFCKWAHCIIEFCDALQEISERFGGASIKDLFPAET